MRNKKKNEQFLPFLLYSGHHQLNLRQNFLISWFTNPPTVIFRKVEEEKNISKKFFCYFIRQL